MADEKIFVNRFGDRINEALKKGAHKTIVRHCDQILRSSQISGPLSESQPGSRIFFGGSENEQRNFFFNQLGINENEIKAAVKESPSVMSSWRIATNTFNWIMILTIRGMEINKASKKEIESVIMLLAVHFTAYISYKFFMYTNKAAMEYMVNTMSKKFLLRRFRTIGKVIEHIAFANHEKMRSKLVAGNDKDLLDYFVYCRSRLNQAWRTMAREYMKVRQEGKYLIEGKNFYDDNTIIERKNLASQIMAIAEEASDKSTRPPNKNLVNLSIKITNSPRAPLQRAIYSISENESEQIRQIINSILGIYADERNTLQGIKSRGWLGFSLGLYARSNTRDGRIEKVKEILDTTLSKISNDYVKTEREATRGALRRGLFIYFCLLAQSLA